MTDEERKKFAKKLQEEKQKKQSEDSLYTKLAKKGWLGGKPKAEVERYPGTTLIQRAKMKYKYEK